MYRPSTPTNRAVLFQLRRAGIALLLALLATTALAVPVAAMPGDADGETLVVDADGGGYEAINPAVADAEAGDTVVVRPGTYREAVTIDADITLVAPDGATIDGTNVDADGAFRIPSERDIAPVIDGFAIVNHSSAVRAWNTDGDWVFRNSTVRNASSTGIVAVRSNGDWTVRNVEVHEARTAIDARSSGGNWTVEDTTLRESDHHGVFARGTDGDWTLRNVTVDGTGLVGVDAYIASDDWTVRNATIENTTVAVNAAGTNGSWAVRRTTIANTTTSQRYDFLKPNLPEGTAIYAGDATGNWSVHESVFRDNDGGIAAPDADPPGTAVNNTWDGSVTPADDDCTGNVVCEGRSTPTPSSTESGEGTETATATRAATERTPDGATRLDQPLSPVVPVAALLAAAALAGLTLRRP
ncbi:right-handed parallel beta-helix repeat-containing protein [Natronomonas sp.]|uniref:right-handed parallel beta-helix repeat-containing protein n=1 Tax=Natronomonas sp. TaxID=2184060 RepID=UPI002FC3A69D